MFDSIVWKLYDISYWLMKMIYLNILWISFSLIGLLLLGFFPATAGMFAVTRKWILGDREIPVFKTFWKNYKTSFMQTNIIGYTFVLAGLILYFDLKFFRASDHLLLSVLALIIIIALIIYFAVALYIFPVYVHFKFKTLEYIKQSIVVVLGKPLNTIMMIVGSYLLYVIFSMIPGLLVFISGSFISAVLMWIALRSFPKHETKASDI